MPLFAAVWLQQEPNNGTKRYPSIILRCVQQQTTQLHPAHHPNTHRAHTLLSLLSFLQAAVNPANQQEQKQQQHDASLHPKPVQLPQVDNTKHKQLQQQQHTPQRQQHADQKQQQQQQRQEERINQPRAAAGGVSSDSSDSTPNASGAGLRNVVQSVQTQLAAAIIEYNEASTQVTSKWLNLDYNSKVMWAFLCTPASSW